MVAPPRCEGEFLRILFSSSFCAAFGVAESVALPVGLDDVSVVGHALMPTELYQEVLHFTRFWRH